MPKPARKDLDAYRGDDFNFRFTFWDNTVDPPEIMPLTGRSYVAQVRPTPDSIFSEDFTVDDTQLAFGYFEISLTRAQMADLPVENWYDIEETVSGATHTIIRGKFTVDKDVTR